MHPLHGTLLNRSTSALWNAITAGHVSSSLYRLVGSRRPPDHPLRILTPIFPLQARPRFGGETARDTLHATLVVSPALTAFAWVYQGGWGVCAGIGRDGRGGAGGGTPLGEIADSGANLMSRLARRLAILLAPPDGGPRCPYTPRTYARVSLWTRLTTSAASLAPPCLCSPLPPSLTCSPGLALSPLDYCSSAPPGLYYKLHGQHRPVNLKKPVIKRRKRVPAAGAGQVSRRL